jgi:hypothetical protein
VPQLVRLSFARRLSSFGTRCTGGAPQPAGRLRLHANQQVAHARRRHQLRRVSQKSKTLILHHLRPGRLAVRVCSCASPAGVAGTRLACLACQRCMSSFSVVGACLAVSLALTSACLSLSHTHNRLTIGRYEGRLSALNHVVEWGCGKFRAWKALVASVGWLFVRFPLRQLRSLSRRGRLRGHGWNCGGCWC